MGNACFGDQGVRCGSRRRLLEKSLTVTLKRACILKEVRDLGDRGIARSGSELDAKIRERGKQ